MALRSVVLGGQGFLGSAVVRLLLSRGDHVVVLDRMASQDRCDTLFGKNAVRAKQADILDTACLSATFKKADEIYHFAGRLGTAELNQDIPSAIEANVTGAVTVFEAAIAAEVPVVFYPSKPNVWLNAYTITKYAAERFGELYGALGGTRISMLRYFNAYGPGQAVSPVRKIIPTFAMQALRGQPLTVFGDGEQTVDMIHATDIAHITVKVVRAGCRHQVMDCGRGIAMTVNEVAAAVCEHFGNRAGIRHVPMRPGETPGTRLVADVAPLRKLIGVLEFAAWQPSLSATLDWYAAEAKLP